MEYLVGLALCLAVGGLAVAIGFDRDRAFYPTVLIVIATYYVLFAAMGASARALIMEIVAASGFSALALIGFKKNLWLVAAAILAHGIFDYLHHFLSAIPVCRVGGRASAWRSMPLLLVSWRCAC